MQQTFASKPSEKFALRNLSDDPLALATVSIGLMAWVISFASSIIAVFKGPYPNYSWWTLAYMFFAIIGITIIIGKGMIYRFHVVIVGSFAAGLVFTTSSVNSLIYSSDAAHEAASAGFILLSMISIVWVVYYGQKPFEQRQIMNELQYPGPASRPMSQRFPPRMQTSQMATPRHPLDGMEQKGTMQYGAPQQNAFGQQNAYPQQNNGAWAEPKTDLANDEMKRDTRATDSIAAPPGLDPEAHYKARAIYQYKANTEDPNEISFDKHEVLEVSGVNGKWWQAKRETGESGIAPSNYLILLSMVRPSSPTGNDLPTARPL